MIQTTERRIRAATTGLHGQAKRQALAAALQAEATSAARRETETMTNAADLDRAPLRGQITGINGDTWERIVTLDDGRVLRIPAADIRGTAKVGADVEFSVDSGVWRTVEPTYLPPPAGFVVVPESTGIVETSYGIARERDSRR